jgi:hypothetical protein
MLLMPTFKIGNPIGLLISVETNNFAGQTLKLSSWLHAIPPGKAGWGV